MSDSSDADLLSIFWVEVNEYLESLNASLLQVETVPPDDKQFHDMLREMNRVAHSMKGAARAVGINVIETIAHYMEEVFAAALNNKLTLTPEVADSLYDGLDLIQNVVSGEENLPETLAAVLANLEKFVAASSEEDEAGKTTTAAHLKATLPVDKPAVKSKDDSKEIPAVHVEDEPPPTPAAPDEPVVLETTEPPLAVEETPGSTQTVVLRSVEETIRVTVSKLDRLMAEASELLVARMHGDERQRKVIQLRRQMTRWQREWRGVRTAYIRLVRRMQESGEQTAAEMAILFKFLEANQRYLFETTRQLAHLSQDMAQDGMHLTTLSDQIQNDIGGMRMMPFETAVGGFQRMVRDLARELKKQIQFEIEGGGVEIDKAVLDALKDPLLHVLRNSIDHGIEMPADREKAGKSPTGHILLAVEQRGSEITISVTDDGHGIDIAAIRRRIVKNGLVSQQEAAALSEEDVRSYIFQSGLTTSDRVTALSGRGIGMDVVRDRIETLRGRVSVQSKLGEGTSIILSVPVSLTRIRCILLEIGGEDYAVPSAMVVRMERLRRDDVFTAEGKEMVLINNQPIPLVSLGAILDVGMGVQPGDELQLVVLRAIDRSLAFEVDELYSETELVLKPLGTELARAPYVSGAALLGTGDVIIVLDANDLVRQASGIQPRRRARVMVAPAKQRALRVLVVDDSITTRTLEKNILETAGFDVHVAIDGVEAWAMINDTDFDVVISDVEMPNMNGLDLTRRVKDSVTTQHIPVILLTSLNKPEQREAGLRAGADAYLVKSRFDQGELLRTIQAVVV